MANIPNNELSNYVLKFEHSGDEVKVFQASIDGGDWFDIETVQGPVGTFATDVPPTVLGQHTLAIRAYNDAGQSLPASIVLNVTLFIEAVTGLRLEKKA